MNTAGGYGVAPTLLIVSSEGKVQAQTVLQNTVITVGRLSYRAESTMNSVKASMQDGRLTVVSTAGIVQIG